MQARIKLTLAAVLVKTENMTGLWLLVQFDVGIADGPSNTMIGKMVDE